MISLVNIDRTRLINNMEYIWEYNFVRIAVRLEPELFFLEYFSNSPHCWQYWIRFPVITLILSHGTKGYNFVRNWLPVELTEINLSNSYFVCPMIPRFSWIDLNQRVYTFYRLVQRLFFFQYRLIIDPIHMLFVTIVYIPHVSPFTPFHIIVFSSHRASSTWEI